MDNWRVGGRCRPLDVEGRKGLRRPNEPLRQTLSARLVNFLDDKNAGHTSDYRGGFSPALLQPQCNPPPSGHPCTRQSPASTALAAPTVHLWLRRSRVRAPSVTPKESPWGRAGRPLIANLGRVSGASLMRSVHCLGSPPCSGGYWPNKHEKRSSRIRSSTRLC